MNQDFRVAYGGARPAANYNHAITILEEIDRFFRENNPVHPGALVFDDDRTLAQHVKEVLVKARPWLYP